MLLQLVMKVRFNTASGKYCCNKGELASGDGIYAVSVSIPQAVSTVATHGRPSLFYLVGGFQYRKR